VISRHSKALAALALTALLGACTTLPTDVERTPSTAFTDWQSTRLGVMFADDSAQHPGQSGFDVLDSGREFFTELTTLADVAEHSIDAQYYIFKDDTAGRLLAARLVAAADRGVRVRVLLDDFPVNKMDEPLAALNTHSSIEVRVYNPLVAGWRSSTPKMLSFFFEFGRVTRRMHNKSYVVDGTVAVVGGRNVGDEYIDNGNPFNFRDRDLIAIGPIVGEVSASFDAYWNSEWAFPIESVVGRVPSPERVREKRQSLEAFAASEDAVLPYHLPDDDVERRAHLDGLPARLLWADAEVVYDVPHDEETQAASKQAGKVATRLRQLALEARKDILIESAYFVPADAALELARNREDNGVRIRVLTNSLASTDVLPAQAGYSRRRPALLGTGTEVYEFRADAESCVRFVLEADMCAPPKFFSLHAKSVVFDRKVVFAGSYNLSPRSVYLNSEITLIVYSPELARIVADQIEDSMRPENSWRVVKKEQGQLEWVAAGAEGERREHRDPGAGAGRRLKTFFYSLFPLENQI
jgi:putative cardiolipin synthase